MPVTAKVVPKPIEDIEGKPCAACVTCGKILEIEFSMLPIPDGVRCATPCQAPRKKTAFP